jgi:thiol-disulfide isomerase/thioredoxin
MNMKKTVLTLLFAFVGLSFSLNAQTITLSFPKFSGKEWDLILLQGLNKDTVLRGVIPDDGKVVLNIPAKRKNYAGMARWMLRNGGGLDFVLNGESFSVECLSEEPNESNIIYTGTVENVFLNQNYRQQEEIMFKYEAVSMALKAYPEGTNLFSLLSKEKKKLTQDYDDMYRELAKSPLYAARFREIVNFTRGTGKSLELDEKGRAIEADNFIRNQMSWPALYTSNHWSGVIFSWAQMHSLVIESDSTLVASTRQILGKLDDNLIYTDFCEQLARYFVKFGKDSLLFELGPEVRGSGKLLRYDGLLAQFQGLQTGERVPDLVLPDGSEMSLTSNKRSTRLLMFYQSDCGHCEDELEKIKANYSTLQNAGIQVITVSGDTDKKVFQDKADSFPWAVKLFDGKGFGGPNFRNFGIAGTPTLLAVDEKGKLLRRSAQFTDMLVWLDSRK